ncbi:hypothetical protein ACFLWI_06170 [Chloroflexota bacterium]
MVRFLKQFLSCQKGQALPIVLALLAIGGLTIAVSLNYATTSLKGSQIVGERIKGIYAADAGVEHVLWSLGKGGEPAEQLSENISGMTVSMQDEDLGTFTLYCGELAEPGAQSNKLDLNSTITWVEGDRYRCDVIVTLLVDQTLFIEITGARIPLGYHYEDDSVTRSDGEAASEPEITVDDHGADLLNWLWQEWGLARPRLDKSNPEFTLTFYINGTGSLSGHYAWVVTDSAAIGLVGEITGTRYRITATAARPDDGRTTAKIVSDVMIQDDGTMYITSWQILN